MKFVAPVKVFYDAMVGVARVVERRNTYPILANVHLTAKDDSLTLRATDLDIEITSSIPVRIAEPGVTTIPATMLTDILKKFSKDAEVSFELKGDEGAKIAAGRSRFNLATLSPDSFPDLKTTNYQLEFDVEAPVLLSALNRVSFCISTEQTRYYLNGVYMHGVSSRETGTGVRFVATDGHRMARCFRAIEAASTMAGIIIPSKTIDEMVKILEKAGDDSVKLSVSETRIKMEHGPTTLISKLIEGTFPDYERVTPKGNNRLAVVDVKQMMTAADRVMTIASEKGGKSVKLTFTDNQIQLEVSNADHGTATEEIAAEFDGDGHVIGFNGRYLVDMLSNAGKGKVTMAMLDPGSPTLITNEDDPTIAFVLMPMRV